MTDHAPMTAEELEALAPEARAAAAAGMRWGTTVLQLLATIAHARDDEAGEYAERIVRMQGRIDALTRERDDQARAGDVARARAVRAEDAAWTDPGERTETWRERVERLTREHRDACDEANARAEECHVLRRERDALQARAGVADVVVAAAHATVSAFASRGNEHQVSDLQAALATHERRCADVKAPDAIRDAQVQGARWMVEHLCDAGEMADEYGHDPDDAIAGELERVDPAEVVGEARKRKRWV